MPKISLPTLPPIHPIRPFLFFTWGWLVADVCSNPFRFLLFVFFLFCSHGCTLLPKGRISMIQTAEQPIFRDKGDGVPSHDQHQGHDAVGAVENDGKEEGRDDVADEGDAMEQRVGGSEGNWVASVQDH